MLPSDQVYWVEELRRSFVYDEELGEVYWNIRKKHVVFGSRAGTVNKGREGLYRRNIKCGQRRFREPVVIWVLKTGAFPPEGMIIDHVNRNPLDNRWANLRLATLSQNQQNKVLPVTTLKGVSFQAGKDRTKPWRARITINRREISLGVYATKEEAFDAYCVAATKYHGEYSNLGVV